MARFNPDKDPKSTKEEESKMLSNNGHGHSHNIPHGMVEEGGFEVQQFSFV